MTLETVFGTLAEVYKLLKPESILHVDELMKERRLHPVTLDGNLRDRCFYTADGIVYSLQGKKKTPTLAMTRARFNPLFQDSTFDEYCQQLLRDRNYRPTTKETKRALSAPDTVVVDLTKLRLQRNDAEYRHFAIDPQNYNLLNPEEKKLAQRVYGQDDDFVQTMETLAKAGISETRVYILDPDYVRIHATENSFGRASWLVNFNLNSGFDAFVRCINSNGRLRGVHREVVVSESAAGAAPENAVPPAPREIKLATMEQVLAYSVPFVPAVDRARFENGLRKLYNP